jgi:hypothetical protein
MERKKTTIAKVLKAWPARGSFKVFASPYTNYQEVKAIESKEDNLNLKRLNGDYYNLLFHIHPSFDEDDIRRCKRNGSRFEGRMFGPVTKDEVLYYEPTHAALQSKIDAVLEIK